jgi:hypothetical protein
MTGFANAVRNGGLEPGVWTSVGFNDEATVSQHPDWFIRDAAGHPFKGQWISLCRRRRALIVHRQQRASISRRSICRSLQCPRGGSMVRDEQKLRDGYQDMIKAFQALPKKPQLYLCVPSPIPVPGGYQIPTTGPDELIPIIQKLADQYQ